MGGEGGGAAPEGDPVGEVGALRAEQGVVGPGVVALAWLVALAGQERLQVWLISSHPLPAVADFAADLADVEVVELRVADVDTRPDACHGVGCRRGRGEACEDLNQLVGTDHDSSVSVRLTVETAGRLRRVYDIEAAALAAAAVLLGCPSPRQLAAARPRVARDVRSLTTTTAEARAVVVPEFARALLRGWSGRLLLPREWAADVAATYLTLRLEDAQRHSGVRLLDSALPLLAPVAWHERSDPGAAVLAWVTRSASRRLHEPADDTSTVIGGKPV